MTWGQVDPTSPIAQMLGVSTANAVEQNETERGAEPAVSSEKPAEAGSNPFKIRHTMTRTIVLLLKLVDLPRGHSHLTMYIHF